MINHSDMEQTPLMIHSNSDYDFAMRISFLRGTVHGFNRMLNYCTKPDNSSISYEQISKVKQAEIKILEDNLEATKKSVNNLFIEACNRIAYKEYSEAQKNKKRVKKRT